MAKNLQEKGKLIKDNKSRNQKIAITCGAILTTIAAMTTIISGTLTAILIPGPGTVIGLTIATVGVAGVIAQGIISTSFPYDIIKGFENRDFNNLTNENVNLI